MTYKAIIKMQPILENKLKSGTKVICCMTPFNINAQSCWDIIKTKQVENLSNMGKLYLYVKK